VIPERIVAQGTEESGGLAQPLERHRGVEGVASSEERDLATQNHLAGVGETRQGDGKDVGRHVTDTEDARGGLGK
jgi:hypothetical protein